MEENSDKYPNLVDFLGYTEDAMEIEDGQENQ